jgi:Tropinone reductase 1
MDFGKERSIVPAMLEADDDGMRRGRRWSLTGRHALVTGGTRGIGQAVVTELLALGAEVSVVARDGTRLEDCSRAWHAHGYAGKIHTTQGDVSLDADRARLFEELGERRGLDILVNNVGTNVRKRTPEYTLEEYQHILATNLTSTFDLCRRAYPLLAASSAAVGGAQANVLGACIVNVVSTAGLTHVRTGSPYGMTKAAAIQLTRNLSAEWASAGIRVNAVAPWYTWTPLARPVLEVEAYRQAVLERTPLGRIAEPEEVAAAIAFLCLPAASYVTGQCLAVDGGFTSYGF